MKKIIAVILVVILAGAVFVLYPKLVLECDDCHETFFGTGYVPNAIQEWASETEMIICEKCALEQHGFALATGKTLEEFKRPF